MVLKDIIITLIFGYTTKAILLIILPLKKYWIINSTVCR